MTKLNQSLHLVQNPAAGQPSVVPWQSAALDTWDKKYRLKDKAGQMLDPTPDDTLKRVARALADVEVPDKRELWYAQFLYALRAGAIPAGRILSNAGAGAVKPNTSTINCTVSGTIGDSMGTILDRVKEAGLTLRAGSGIGYEFSTLRPKGALVVGAGAYTSGPLSFMDIFDKVCQTISSAGGRRGAQMATFDVQHPDVLDFIRAKREDGRLRQFNLSLLITEEFMVAVEQDREWPLVFPVLNDAEAAELNLNDPKQVVWRMWPYIDPHYTVNQDGLVACKVYRALKARELWDTILRSAYEVAEPGFILIDKMNEMNNNWFCEDIRASNPCAEQGLPPYGACNLGSVNLTRFVREPFTPKAHFDWEEYRKVVGIFTRLLDNVVEINGLPLERQREEILRKRRHGMGYLGLGSTLTLMGLRYGSTEAQAFTEEVTRTLVLEGWRVALQLAKEKGPAPLLQDTYTVSATMLRQRPEMAHDGYRIGDCIPGRVLHAKYSRYLQRIATLDPALVEDLAKTGARFTHHSSIAPTGTISLSYGNNCSNGIEPSFEHSYLRNVIREGKQSKDQMQVYSYELLAYRQAINPNASPGAASETDRLPDYFVTADDVSPTEHVDMQAAAQRWIDSSISKTANVPTDMPFEKFKELYRYAYQQGLKGCTVFRFNPEVFQGVLVRAADLKATHYEFTLDDGSVVELAGDDRVEYQGEEHTGANLFDALKENYLGRY